MSFNKRNSILGDKLKEVAKQGIVEHKGYTSSAGDTDLQTFLHMQQIQFLYLFSPKIQLGVEEVKVILFPYWTSLFLSSQMLYLLVF